MDQTFEKRKKVIFDFISDDLYVPMKIKEISAVLQIPREQRDELRAVLDSLVEEGKITERGTHSELLEQNGIYAGLYRTQAQYYA